MLTMEYQKAFSGWVLDKVAELLDWQFQANDSIYTNTKRAFIEEKANCFSVIY